MTAAGPTSRAEDAVAADAGTESNRLDAWMQAALDEARTALLHDDVPVGAVVADLDSGAIVARGRNEREVTGDPTAHAELLAVRRAAEALGTWRLDGHAVAVTLEPCPMCAGAIWAARVPLLVFGAADPKAGAAGSLYNFSADPRLNHTTRVVDGVRADEAAALLRDFFATRRADPATP